MLDQSVLLRRQVAFILLLVVSTSLASANDQFSGPDSIDAKEAGGVLRRTKRNIVQFGEMIKCRTGRSWSDYIGYGCYCGLGGQGAPVDGTDRCCQEHDACYDQIIRNCRVYSDVYTRIGCTGCAPQPVNDACELAICECDSAAANCFANNRFNPMYKNYPKCKCK